MNYELAKKLKDAGFPQNINEEFRQSDGTFYHPTLSELIEVCGDKLSSLIRKNNAWEANSSGIKKAELFDGPVYYSECWYGSTPEEAVANLWLALNKK